MFDFSQDFSKLNLVIKEPLSLILLERRYEQFFSFNNSPEPLKLRIARASGAEIKLELEVIISPSLICNKTYDIEQK